MKRHILRSVSLVLMLSFTLQLLIPLKAYALTTGPSQPEVQAFEPVGTTEMVDLFSGDFVYNIPLMDVDGYPVNLSYHSGVSMEQEASWVGLGWSLNPGEINRSVRGMPDDFNGQKIRKTVKIDEETNFMGRTGSAFGLELFGFDFSKFGLSLGADLSMYMNFNNYKGISAGVRAGTSAAIHSPGTENPANSIGYHPSIGVGSQSGTDLDASLNFRLSNASKESRIEGGVGTGINSRRGMTNISFNVTLEQGKNYMGDGRSRTAYVGPNFTSNIPIGIQNYVPVITNASILKSFDVQLKVGGEFWGGYPNFFAGVSVSKMNIEQDGTRAGYGYMYLENAGANNKDILDFTRDRDGMYNKTMRNLPPSSLAYDIYSVSGQGTGGSFRPFRNDIGTIYDPQTGEDNKSKSGAIEVGIGNLFSIGGEVNFNHSVSTTGPWVTVPFQGEKGGVYEKLFFKQGGELTYNQQAGSNANLMYTSSAPIGVSAVYTGNVYQSGAGNVKVNYSNSLGSGQLTNGLGYDGMIAGRTARGNLITVLTADKATSPYISSEPKIANYSGDFNNLQIANLDRYDANASGDEQKSRISYISQLLPDGRRYIYGIPAMNNISQDVTFGSDGGGSKTGKLIDNIGITTPTGSSQAPEHYYSSTTTPAYAHSFLLTEVLSTDYVDVTGNGCSDDDLGGYVKLNYSRKSNDYRWRSPAYNVAQGNVSGHFDPGFQSDPRDGRVNVSMGSREQWYVNTIESKNLVAEFYTSARSDARGMPDDIAGESSFTKAAAGDQNSYKLDSIRLFNKNERYQRVNAAVPIKTIIFNYDYSLCPGTPNSVATGGGKLTLKSLYIRYGNSDKNLMSPYRFEYNQPTVPYNYARKDRWGNVNDVNPDLHLDPAINSFEFPYTSQKAYAVNASPVTAYNLSHIILPSGGKINIDYEADDYAYVQNKRATEMVKLEGLGSNENFQNNSLLYQGDAQYNYLYFHRDMTREWGTPSNGDLKPFYLEGETHLYFSVSTDIRSGNYESIKGFGEIENVGICANNAAYGYVKLKKVSSNGISFSPVTLYCMNFSKWYLNHIVYPGYGTTDLKEVLKAFAAAAGEIKHLTQPLKTLRDRGYCKNVDLGKSWIRLQTPSLAKKGGGVRVKRLTLEDSWGDMTGSNIQENGNYGREYDYTIEDPSHGNTSVSSGVASYEPLVGGDENPLRSPIPYTAAENIALPAMEFYQLEPLGESFYPAPVVGYSSVRVRSINIDKGKSSMSEEEHLFYTAKDYPVRIEYTSKTGNSFTSRSLLEDDRLEQAAQGYTLYLNDMHGKPKASNSYVVTRFDNNKVQEREPVNSVVYYYNESTPGNLSSMVKAFKMEDDGYKIHDMELGKETDVVFDSRQHYDESESAGASLNLNVFTVTPLAIGVPSVFPSYKKEKTIFHSMVSTKVVQQYGILKKVVTNDHGAETVMENMVYDAESGNVLLSRTSNEFKDNEYMQRLPAFLAYDGMGPAYRNIGIKDNPQNLYINRVADGYMSVDNINYYATGDELFYRKGSTIDKLWVMDRKSVGMSEYYGYSGSGQGTMAFFPDNNVATPQVTVKIRQIISGTPAATGPDLQPATVYNGDPWNLVFNGNNSCSLAPGLYKITLSAPQNGSINSQEFNATINAGDLLVYKITKSVGYVDGSGNPTSYNLGHSQVFENKCLLKVLPRFTNAHPLNSMPGNYWWAANIPKKVFGFSTEIVRSGRRNMLGSTIQQLTTQQAPASLNDGMDLDHFLVKTGLLSVSAQTYKDAAASYEGYDRTIVPVSSGSSDLVYEGMNSFVLGMRGNFRPETQLTAFANRDYTYGHARKDGTFSVNNLYWQQATKNPAVCAWMPYVSEQGQNDLAWKRSVTVTKYDMFGNAIEEKDALNIYSTA